MSFSLRPSNVNYSQPTESRPIPIRLHGKTYYISPLYTAGNNKLANNIYGCSLPAIVTCPNHKLCADSCWGANGLRASVYNKRALILEWYKEDKNAFLAECDKEFDEMPDTVDGRPTYARPNTVGDFFSPEYLKDTTALIKNHKDKRFYTYTKVLFLFVYFSAWMDLFKNDNVSIINSTPLVYGEHWVNYGPEEEIKEIAAKRGEKVCDYGINETHEHCGVDCFHCMTAGVHHYTTTWFKAHGCRANKAPSIASHPNIRKALYNAL